MSSKACRRQPLSHLREVLGRKGKAGGIEGAAPNPLGVVLQLDGPIVAHA